MFTLLLIGFTISFALTSWYQKGRASGALCYFYCAVCIIFFGVIAYFLLYFAYHLYLDNHSHWILSIPAIPFVLLTCESVRVAAYEFVNTPTHIVYKSEL